MKENDLLRLIRERRSIVRFQEWPVSDENIEAILEAGRWAPSYINSQPWEFIVIRSARLRARVADILRRLTISWQAFFHVPVIIIIAVNAETDPRHFLEDGAAAAQNIALMAHSLGLATRWVGLYGGTDQHDSPENELRNLLRVPRSLRLVAAMPVGMPDGAGEEAVRRPLAEMVHEDVYSVSRRRRKQVERT